MAKFSKVDVSGVLKKSNASKDVLREETILMAEEVAKFGSERMKEYIEQRGTPFSKAAQSAGINMGPGRKRTGNMYDSVDYRVETGDVKISAAFGWLRNFEKYFSFQESGFKNIYIASYTGSGKLRVGGGQPIVRKNPFGGFKNTPGMFALRDARADTAAEVPKIAKKYKDRITRRAKKK